MGRYTHEKEVFVTKKALGCANEDLEVLGIEHSHLNINLPALMMENPDEEAISFLLNEKTYWFSIKAVEEVDGILQEYWKYHVACTAILLNAPRLFDSRKEEALLKKVIHPDFEWDREDAFISAFPMENEESRGYYEAFVSFLAERYMRDDARYGRLTGFIVSNEVNSQCVWGNAGQKTVEDYVREYTKALKLTWETSHKYWEQAEVYVSLDHFWQECFRPLEPLSTYPGRTVIDLVSDYAKEMGDFGWGVAYHPYPEDLNYPDFYNDRIPTFYFDTKIITFKNMEVLHEYFGQERLLYQGERRPIIFSEQGFHAGTSHFTENQGAAAYVLAYQKMKKLPGILWMTHHAYVDNLHEFGLHLGIRERNEDGTPGRKRPIYYVIRAMGTEEEAWFVQWARTFIGEELFDSLLTPVVHAEDSDKSVETEFGN